MNKFSISLVCGEDGIAECHLDGEATQLALGISSIAKNILSHIDDPKAKRVLAAAMCGVIMSDVEGDKNNAN